MSGLRDQLRAIYEAHGKLTPQIVLNEARDPGHPLHSQFTWDDAEAAERYRLEQAHELIRVARISFTPPDGAPSSIREWVSVRRDTEFVYEPAEKIAKDDILRKIVMQDLTRAWKLLKKRAEGYEEFFALVRDDLDDAA